MTIDDGEKLRIRKVADQAELRSIEDALTKGQKLQPYQEEFLARYRGNQEGIAKGEEKSALQITATFGRPASIEAAFMSLDDLVTVARPAWRKMHTLFPPGGEEEAITLPPFKKLSSKELLIEVLEGSERGWPRKPQHYRALMDELRSRGLLPVIE